MKPIAGRHWLGAVLFSAVIVPSPLHVQVEPSSSCIPPPDTNYAYLSQFHLQALQGLIDLKDVSHYGFSQCDTPPDALGTSQDHVFASFVSGKLSFDGGMNYTSIVAPCYTAVVVTLDSSVDNTSYDSAEMTQLDISGGTLPAGYMVRESPTLHSKGYTTISGSPFTYQVTSYFDIYPDLSNNYGAFWVAADSVAHVELKYRADTIAWGIPQVAQWPFSVRHRIDPANGNLLFIFSTDFAGNANAVLHDMPGRNVYQMINGETVPGKESIFSLSSREFNSGIYVYRLASVPAMQSGKVFLTGR